MKVYFVGVHCTQAYSCLVGKQPNTVWRVCVHIHVASACLTSWVKRYRQAVSIHTPILTPSHTLSHPPTPSHTLSHPPTPSHTLPHSFTPSHTLSHPPTPSHTLSHTLSHPLTSSHTLTPSHILTTPTPSNTQDRSWQCGEAGDQADA